MGLHSLARPERCRFHRNSVMFEADVVSRSVNRFGKAKGHVNKLLRVTAILMHSGSFSCCHRINLENSRDYPPAGTELIAAVQEEQ